MNEMKPWQRGIDLPTLKAIAAVFREFDRGHIHGAFTAAKENTVADWMSRGTLYLHKSPSGRPVAAAVAEAVTGTRQITAFADRVIGTPSPGALRIRRIAAPDALLPALARGLMARFRNPAEIWLEGWVEHPGVRRFAELLGAGLSGSKVMAGSEIIGVYTRGAGTTPPPPIDMVALRRLNLPSLKGRLVNARRDIAGVSYADHYSGYNKRHSWSAIALRGFRPADPGFIIKPAEMSRGWKKENPEAIDWKCGDTILREKLPGLEPLVRAVPGDKERVRLMRLAPGGGELTRHADITDPDAGTDPGQLLRIHVPIVTNPDVIFTQWLLNGEKITANMAAGEAWYLDTRKPHTAINGGASERIHLVMDVFSNPELLKCLE